jgi:uncharacterized FlaG/YvyC family protein
VAAADLSYKRTAQTALGGALTARIDLDEFVSKCINFMRDADVAPSQRRTSSQAVRRGQGRTGDDGETEDDPLNWEWLGSRACLPYNARPSLPGFLLGPLSVQKRVRQVIQRRAPQERRDPANATKPQDLKESDLENQNANDVAKACKELKELLNEFQAEAEKKVNRELSELDEEPSPEVVKTIMDKHGIADDGGVPLFRFCFNPTSFGQTVENLFYVSFLIRDGSAGISMDSDDIPTLRMSQSGPQPSLDKVPSC